MKCLSLFLVSFALANAANAAMPFSPVQPLTRGKKASFTENWSRYPSPDVIIARLHQDFPDGAFTYTNTGCNIMNDENRGLLGDSSPQTGKPAVDNPNSSFISWYSNCVTNLIKNEAYASGGTDEERFKQINGELAFGLCQKAIDSKYEKDLAAFKDEQKNYDEVRAKYQKDLEAYRLAAEKARKNKSVKVPSMPEYPTYHLGFEPRKPVEFHSTDCNWTELNADAKTRLINQFLERYIGPNDVIVDLQLADSEQELSEKIRDYVDDYAQAQDARFDFLFATKEKDLILERAVRVIKLLIHLEDIQKF